MSLPRPSDGDRQTARRAARSGRKLQLPTMDPIDRQQFEDLVTRALDEIPAQFSEAFDEVAVVVEDESPPGGAVLFGLYQGVPRTWGDRSGHPPPHISIFMGPLARAFGHDHDELVRQIRITVLHELGHHLGMDEDQLDRLGYG